MTKKKPNNYFAPFVIAGLTIGLLASAYKFVFAKEKPKIESKITEENLDKHQKNQK